MLLPQNRELRAQYERCDESAEVEGLMLHQVVTFRLADLSEADNHWMFSSLDDLELFLARRQVRPAHGLHLGPPQSELPSA